MAMDGETVGLDERFSNGADYPGDLGLSAEESVNCACTMDVGVVKASRRSEPSFVSPLERENAANMRESVSLERTLGPEDGKDINDYFEVHGCNKEMLGVLNEAISYIPRDWLDDLSEWGLQIQCSHA